MTDECEHRSCHSCRVQVFFLYWSTDAFTSVTQAHLTERHQHGRKHHRNGGALSNDVETQRKSHKTVDDPIKPVERFHEVHWAQYVEDRDEEVGLYQFLLGTGSSLKCSCGFNASIRCQAY